MTRTERFKPWVPKIAMLTLAFGSSVGVYRFSLLFFEWWIAFIVACSFELTYLGLAVVRANMTEDARKQAIWLSRSAAGVAMLIVTLDGFFHLRPSLLAVKPWYIDLALALVHGIPLPYIAYRMSNLLLHQDVETLQQRRVIKRRPMRKRTQHKQIDTEAHIPLQEQPETVLYASETQGPKYITVNQKTLDIVKLWNDGMSKVAIGEYLGISRQAVQQHIRAAQKEGVQVRPAR